MKSFLLNIYAYKFFDELILIYPLYAVMFADFGVKPHEIGILFATWSAVAFLLEVPSGTLADKFSRKHILFFSQLTRALGYAVWLLFPNFAGFLIGFIFWGIESAFTSGTFEALVYDELQKFNRTGEYTKVIGRAKGAGFISFFLASLGASGAIVFGYGFVLIISIISLVMSALSIILLPQAQVAEKTETKDYFSLLKSGVSLSIRNGQILHLIVFFSLTIGLCGALDEFWTLFADDAGMPKYGLGIFLAGLSVALAVGSAVAHRVQEAPRKTFYILFAAAGLLLILAAVTYKVYSVVLLIVFNTVFQVIEIVFEGKLQDAIPAETRATISSVKGLFTETVALTTFLAFGAVAGVLTYQQAFIIFGVLTTVVGLLYVLLSFGRKAASS